VYLYKLLQISTNFKLILFSTYSNKTKERIYTLMNETRNMMMIYLHAKKGGSKNNISDHYVNRFKKLVGFVWFYAKYSFGFLST